MTDLQTRAEALRALAAERAEDNEANRRLAPDLVDALRDAGVLSNADPTELGGSQTSPVDALHAAETIARGDAATGWCVGIAMTSSLLAAYLPERGAAEVFGDPRTAAAGVWAPMGRATPVDGGYVVSGRWPFSSGVTHSDHFVGGAIVVGEKSAEGGPVIRAMAMPVADLDLLDTWHTNGLAGTGSTDTVADEVFVSHHRVIDLAAGPRIDAPLYRFPPYGYFALSVAAATLGNAQAAVEDLHDFAVAKKGGGSSKTLAERTTIQARYAEAVAALRAARTYYFSAVETAWEAAQHGEVSVADRTDLRLAATHAARTAAEVVTTMYDLAGGSAIYRTSPLQRRLRDATTATAHIQISPSVWETTGRILLDQPTNVGQL